MQNEDFHIHTSFSDGDNTPEEMIQAAIALGMDAIGFSDHSYTPFDDSYCIPKEKVNAYLSEVRRLREKYAGQIRVLCGIEQDYGATLPTDDYDYVIGSVHYLPCEDEYIPVDENTDVLYDAIDYHFGGDPYAFVEKYYETVAEVVSKTNATIIGHFDVISKFNEDIALFDESHPRYRAAWKKAADTLLTIGVPFEINFGAVISGRKSVPYPSTEIQEYLKAHGAQFVISSDSHSVDMLKRSRQYF